MKLHEIAERIDGSPEEPPPDWEAIEIASVTEDSRKVRPGTLFVAVAGEKADGALFAPQAVGAGAVAVAGAGARPEGIGQTPYLRVEHPRRAAALAAHAVAGDPSRGMCVAGVTGTNGKTSSVLMIQHILERAGLKAAAFGTLGYRIGDVTLPAKHTTPFGEELADVFASARDAGMTHVVMEVSSHALDQERVAGIRFGAAAFTNLTQDHLDYHKDLEAYRKAKLLLFERVEGECAFTAVNAGDPSAPFFIEASAACCYTYGLSSAAVAASNIRSEQGYTLFHVTSPWGESGMRMRLLGRHNVCNALCAITVCGGLGLPLDTIADGLASAPCVPGRFERIEAGQPFDVVVDYAHTEDGLLNVLEAARAICRGRLLVVFGCGGDRDKGKRPKMAAVAARLADYAIITSDNPRTEEPRAILDDVEAGMLEAGKKRGEDYEVIEDRAGAIHRAIGLAGPGDFVMLAGKGHEDYQILGAERIHFDDREVARQALEAG